MRKFWLKTSLLLALCTASSVADEAFDVHDVGFVRSDDGYAVRAKLLISQPERLEALLRGGYHIPLHFELHFKREKEWWFDTFIGDIKWRGVLSYNPLLKRYLLKIGNSESRYISFDRLIKKVRNLRGAPSNVPDYVKIFSKDGVYVEVRFFMETSNLPEPIKIALLLDNSWDSGGRWRTFSLEVED